MRCNEKIDARKWIHINTYNHIICVYALRACLVHRGLAQREWQRRGAGSLMGSVIPAANALVTLRAAREGKRRRKVRAFREKPLCEIRLSISLLLKGGKATLVPATLS